MKKMNYPMSRMHCGAITRAGGSCRQPAMKNGRCRLHGGKSLSGKAHGRYRTGKHTKEAIVLRNDLRELIQITKNLIQDISTY
ncbi:MAG: HGGxSTG domain-containing protein [Desulfuromonadaceae bacterium]|nr:HGGxSTG domain-containing protein [Desulfuromonadaceae bacterium]